MEALPARRVDYDWALSRPTFAGQMVRFIILALESYRHETFLGPKRVLGSKRKWLSKQRKDLEEYRRAHRPPYWHLPWPLPLDEVGGSATLLTKKQWNRVWTQAPIEELSAEEDIKDKRQTASAEQTPNGNRSARDPEKLKELKRTYEEFYATEDGGEFTKRFGKNYLDE
jgi:hypothetical protein